MPIYEPVHRSTAPQQNYLHRLDKRQKKSRHLQDDSDSETTTNSDDDNASTVRLRSSLTQSFRPINQTDPYHVAGLSRQADLPPYPFPHAAPKQPPSSSSWLRPIDDELAALNPPIFSQGDAVTQSDGPLRRHHITNLTAILHKSLRENDWTRASRAFAILIRTEVSGLPPDLRRNGLWTIGAEILMRCEDPTAASSSSSRETNSNDDVETGSEADGHNHANDDRNEEIVIADRGFELAREYYQSLILQYPSTRYSHHSLDALAIYPALFSTWIYQVQARSKRERRRARASKPERDGSRMEKGEDDSSDAEVEDDDKIVQSELEDAGAIATRLDEVLLSPPYDNSLPLLRTRGMIAIWISDLCTSLTRKSTRGRGERELKKRADRERSKGSVLLTRVQEAGMHLGISLVDIGETSELMSE